MAPGYVLTVGFCNAAGTETMPADFAAVIRGSTGKHSARFVEATGYFAAYAGYIEQREAAARREYAGAQQGSRLCNKCRGVYDNCKKSQDSQGMLQGLLHAAGLFEEDAEAPLPAVQQRSSARLQRGGED